jgi:hypothetical protein
VSNQVTEAFVKQFSNNVFHLSQQKGSKLRPMVRIEAQKGESAFYERIGAAVAQLKVGRHADTPQIDSLHSRRRVTMADYEWADLIDKQDRIRMLIDPEGPYTQSAMWALGRAMDDVIISAADGTAYSGPDGSTSVAHPNSQKIASVASGAGVNLRVEALRHAKEIFDSNDVDESIPRYIAVTSSQIRSLLAQTEVTSSDFNSVKALVEGKIDTFMGFKFVRTERLLTVPSTLAFNVSTGVVGSGGGNASGYRRVLAWAGDGLLLANGMDMTAKISERADKSYATQVYACMSIGATRLEEEKVVSILCNEA